MKSNELQQKIEDGMLSLAENRFAETMAAIEQEQTKENAIDSSSISSPGENVILFSTPKKHTYIRAVAACVLLCLCLSGAFQYRDARQNVTVTMDVNPGISMKVNKKMCVKNIQSTNEDGANLLSHVNIPKGLSLNNAVNELLAELEKENYLTENSGIIFGLDGKIDATIQTVQETIATEITSNIQNNRLSKVSVAYCNFSKKTCKSGKEEIENELVAAQVVSAEVAKQLNVSELLSYSKQLTNKNVTFVADETTEVATQDNAIQEQAESDSAEPAQTQETASTQPSVQTTETERTDLSSTEETPTSTKAVAETDNTSSDVAPDSTDSPKSDDTQTVSTDAVEESVKETTTESTDHTTDATQSSQNSNEKKKAKKQKDKEKKDNNRNATETSVKPEKNNKKPKKDKTTYKNNSSMEETSENEAPSTEEKSPKEQKKTQGKIKNEM